MGQHRHCTVMGHTWNDLLNMIDDNNMVNYRGVTLLMFAAANGKVEAVQVLVNSKASIDIQDQDGHTALNAAQALGKTECAKLMIAAALERDLSRVAQN